MKLIPLSAALLIATGVAAFAAEPPHLGDANPPGAWRQGGVPLSAVMRRDDNMAPPMQQNFRSRQVSGRPQEFGNNPTPTRNDPAGTRTQCRGGC